MERGKLNKTEEDPAEGEDTVKDSKLRKWLKKIGVAGFLFFLIKGIVWLFVFFGLFKFAGC